MASTLFPFWLLKAAFVCFASSRGRKKKAGVNWIQARRFLPTSFVFASLNEACNSMTSSDDGLAASKIRGCLSFCVSCMGLVQDKREIGSRADAVFFRLGAKIMQFSGLSGS